MRKQKVTIAIKTSIIIFISISFYIITFVSIGRIPFFNSLFRNIYDEYIYDMSNNNLSEFLEKNFNMTTIQKEFQYRKHMRPVLGRMTITASFTDPSGNVNNILYQSHHSDFSEPPCASNRATVFIFLSHIQIHNQIERFFAPKGVFFVFSKILIQ